MLDNKDGALRKEILADVDHSIDNNEVVYMEPKEIAMV